MEQETKEYFKDKIAWELTQSEIPDYVRESIILYLTEGLPPGKFMEAVLCNDLRNAVNRADGENIALLPDYIKFLYWSAPSRSWGSVENYDSWINGFKGSKDDSNF